MKQLFALALAAAIFSGFASQGQDPKAILQQVREFQTKAYDSAPKPFTQEAFDKIQVQVKQMIRDSLKDVDPAKVDAKDSYDWAELYSMIDEHKTVCDLAHKFLTTNPTPEQKFQDQLLMMRSCNALGEADMLESTLTDVAPTSSNDSLNLAYQVGDFVDTIASKKGNDEGMKVLDQVQSHLKLADPKEAAKKRLEAEKNPPKGNGNSIPATRIGGTNGQKPLTDDEKLAQYEKQAQAQNDSVLSELVMKKASLFQQMKKKDQAVASISDFIKGHPSLSPSAKNQLEMSSKQIGLTMMPATDLQAEKTIGSFSGLGALKGKVVVLDFFAHWCGPCMASVPSMVDMYSELHDKGLEIIGVTQYYGFFGKDRGITPEDEFTKLQGLITDKKMTWPIVVGPKDNSQAYGVWGIPETVIIDKQGVIRDIKVGYDPAQEAAIKKEIEDLLKE
ncbi:MAG: TlpA family protein disulfide reductase [Armatimonadetes bacterium]|nr:TlpA family protein disulfide reductase [Armatimonadota bacterium]